MLVVNDALDAIFVGSFLFGLIFTVASLVLGFADIGGHDSGHGTDHTGDRGHGLGVFNVSTILAFITWFGGAGYLVRHGIGAALPVSLLAAIGGGVLGGAVISWFFVHILRPADKVLDPEDFRLPGTIARVSSSIRESGTGEVIYEQGGTRQVTAARAVDGLPIPRGIEVVIVRYEHGVALVEPWTSFVGEELPAVNPAALDRHAD